MVIDIEKIQEDVDKTNEALDSLVNEFENYIVSSSDGRQINKFYELNGIRIEDASKEINTNSNRDIKEVFFYGKTKKIFDKIKEHALYFKENGEIKYKLFDEFKSEEEVKSILEECMSCKVLERDSKKYIFNFLNHLEKRYNLSARQTLVIESVYSRVKKYNLEKEQGVIHLLPLMAPVNSCFSNDIGSYIGRVVNFGLGKGRRSFIKNGNLEEFRKQHLDLEGNLNLNDLKQKIKKLPSKSPKLYDEAILVLEDFLKKANPDKYDIVGYKAIPRN